MFKSCKSTVPPCHVMWAGYVTRCNAASHPRDHVTDCQQQHPTGEICVARAHHHHHHHCNEYYLGCLGLDATLWSVDTYFHITGTVTYSLQYFGFYHSWFSTCTWCNGSVMMELFLLMGFHRRLLCNIWYSSLPQSWNKYVPDTALLPRPPHDQRGPQENRSFPRPSFE